jgi:hypothetical protein
MAAKQELLMNSEKFKETMDAFVNGDIFLKTNVISNFFTIFGVSFATLFSRSIFEKLLGPSFNFPGLLLSTAVILFWAAVFFLILSVIFLTKKWFRLISYGLIVYYLLVIAYWLLGLAILGELGPKIILGMSSS